MPTAGVPLLNGNTCVVLWLHILAFVFPIVVCVNVRKVMFVVLSIIIISIGHLTGVYVPHIVKDKFTGNKQTFQ